MSRDSLKFDLNRLALAGGGEHSHKSALSDLTVKSYKSSNAKFADFCKSELGVKSYAQLERYGVGDAINKYIDRLQADGKTAQTIHTYIAPVCKACNISMNDVDHPKRISADNVRGRYAVERSEREQNLGRYKDSVDLQKALGIRSNELKHLYGRDLIEGNGTLYVKVENGKGGKIQLQRVLPQYEDVVRSAFEGVGKNDLVLKPEQVSKNINYHGMRADVAKEAYKYYVDLFKNPVVKARFQRFLVAKYTKMAHPSEYALKRYSKTVYDDSVYKLRGENLRLALEKGLPVEYDRLALLAVSVEHLSHWRLDVTVSNYMLA